MSINSQGTPVGLSALDPTGLKQHPFVWDHAVMADLDVFPSITVGFQEYGSATSINNHGVVVGTATAYFGGYSQVEPPDYGLVLDQATGLNELVKKIFASRP
ncbi:MAG TPA: hypothetical protein VGM76_06255 [Lacipirellulaceae bacterium]|jgi:hypothetical protein